MASEVSTKRVWILDGGFSTQLAVHVGAKVDGDPLWSARFLHTHPDAVVATHLDFLRAGSDIIETNTYQASVGGFVKHLGLTTDESFELICNAVKLAKRARATFLQEYSGERRPLIAGSVGPYGAHLHDASEYSGNYADFTAAETMREWHRPRIKALISAGVDLLAFETIPCQKEAEVLVELLKEFPDTEAWITFSVKDGCRLAHGENFQEVAQKCWNMNSGQLLAVGVNCCSPLIIPELFKGINEGRKEAIPLVTYPNSGEKYNPEEGWVDKDHVPTLDHFVHEWLDLGVRYIGGCCRTYAADIEKISTQVKIWIQENNN